MKILMLRFAAIVTGLLAFIYQPVSPEGVKNFSGASAEISPEMMALSPNVNAIVNSNNRFALELYQQLSPAEGNLFFSPYSLSTALAMTYGGADGKTAKQMAEVLHLNLESEAIHSAFSQLADMIHVKSAQGYQIQIANRLWGQQEYGFLANFINLTQEYYGASLQQIDFENEPEAARNTINQWVAEQTKQTIKDLIPAGILNQLTRLVLTNAIYFQGNWLLPFEAKNTKQDLFTLLSGEQITVPLMYQQNRFWYGNYDGVEVLRLFYVDYGVSMLILLPESTDGLVELEQQLSPELLESFIASANREYMVDLWLPKFKIAAEFELKQTLSQMGMDMAFSKENANFSRMNGNSQGLYLSAVVHKAFVDVNEVGTEASGASGAIAGSRSTAPPASFRADRPFIFFIQDNESDSILFLGRVVNPLN